MHEAEATILKQIVGKTIQRVSLIRHDHYDVGDEFILEFTDNSKTSIVASAITGKTFGGAGISLYYSENLS